MLGEEDTRGKLNAIEAIDAAIQRTREILFEPFLYSKWLNLGVIFFLAAFAGGGGGIGGNFGTSFGSSLNSIPSGDIVDAYQRAENWVLSNLGAIIAIGVPIFLILVMLGIGLTYLGARGTMMAYRAVAHDDEGIGANWEATGGPAWRYFVLLVEISIVSWLYFLTIGIISFVLIRNMVVEETFHQGSVLVLGILGAVTILVWIVLTIVYMAMHNFIAPLMLHFNFGTGEAWGQFIGITRGNFGHVALFVLIKIVYSFIYGMAGMFAICCTCYLGMLPVIHQAILAPLLVFERAYALQVIGSLGPEYEIIQRPEPLPPPPPPTIYPPPPPDINR
jgi:hypothetical protein